MNNQPILFMSPKCGACKSQKKILNDYFISKGITGSIQMVNVDKYPTRFAFVEVLPTWLFPVANGKFSIQTGILNPNQVFSFGNKRGSKFGNKLPLYTGINDLEYYGKNFPNNKGFVLPESYYQTVENTWGKGNDTLNAGVGGTRSLGPDKIQDMYTSGYFNDIRMAHPSDQLGTALYLNRSCNHKTSEQSPGMVSSSNSPQIVDNTTGLSAFGNKRRSRFGGGLYSQMGPYKSGSHYLVNQDTGDKLYSGARQYETPRPNKVMGSSYISQAPEYKGYKGYKGYTGYGEGSEFVVNFGKKKILNVSGKKAVNIKINIKQNNRR
jgi:hypothetical protein